MIPPLRIMSRNPDDRQFAGLNLYIQLALRAGREVYVGTCGCPAADKLGILIAGGPGQLRCIACGEPITLTWLPTRYEAMEEENGWMIKFAKNSDIKSTAVM